MISNNSKINSLLKMKYLATLLFLFSIYLLFSFQIVKNEDLFIYKDIPAKYKRSKGNLGKSNLITKKIRDASYSIVNCLPDGYDKEGNVDYTDLIQLALDTHNEVIFPEFPLMINSKGLSLKSNSRIIFKKGSKLLLKPNSNQNYEILRLHEINNVTVYSPTIIGDREAHTGAIGEWGFGISIRGSQSIKILNAVVKNCWGDGIYIGSIGVLHNSDILIENSVLDNNRRNGISIISGINVSIINSLISNTNGTAPMSGIDLEPNNNNEVLENVNISDVVTFNNKNEGILISLRGLYGKKSKKINFTIVDHIDDGSNYAMGFAFPKQIGDFINIKGKLNIINSTWKNNTSNLVRFHDNNMNFINVKLVHPKVINNGSDFSQKKMVELQSLCRKRNFFLEID